MANERTYPCLPCPDLNQAIEFYEALGFVRTYRQARPNPYAVVVREDIQIHLFGLEHFNPADSYGSVIIAAPDPDALYQAFATGLRASYGRLPSAGIPRILRPRKRYGTVRGFTVVDVGGNWLRVYRMGDTEAQATAEKTAGLASVVLVAARLGDSHGDDAAALKTLESGIARHGDAPTVDRVRALLYRAELAVRLNDLALAQSSLDAAEMLTLTDEERAAIADDLAHTTELVSEHRHASPA
jgi:catechol 2,3-dioxygenase-like lactoylglutathione lyase family enzyme